MAVRTLNYTGRVDIPAGDVTVRLRDSGAGVASFDADIANLTGLVTQGDARVSVEAYRQTIRMTFDFGTVDAVRPPEDRQLTEFGDAPQLALFRVRVTDTTQNVGRLLAEVSQVSPLSQSDAEADSLLAVEQAPLPSQVPYRIVMPENLNERVRLEINQDVDNWKGFAEHPTFQALIGPVVLREVLTWCLLVDEAELERDEAGRDDWPVQWVRLAQELNRADGPPPLRSDGADAAEVRDWIEAAVANDIVSGSRTRLASARGRATDWAIVPQCVKPGWNWSPQTCCCPARHISQQPQATTNGTVTRSPGRQRVTAGPTASTTPAVSCPGTFGSVMPSSCPIQPCQSLRHSPVASMRSTTPSAGGVGSGTSSTAIDPPNEW